MSAATLPWEREFVDATGLVLICQNCGEDRLSVASNRRGTMVLACSTCRSEIEIRGADVRDCTGVVTIAEDLPDRMRAIGQDRSDPWVPLRMRLKLAQRGVIQRAAKRVREIHGKPTGPLTIGWALEMICADFIAGDGRWMEEA